MAVPRISTGQALSNFVWVKNPLVLQSTAAAMTKTMPLVVAPVLDVWIGSAVFSALAKVKDSCQSKIGCNSQPFCTNDSLFAKDEGTATSSLVWRQLAPCDQLEAVQPRSLRAGIASPSMRRIEFPSALRRNRRLVRIHRSLRCPRNRRSCNHYLQQEPPPPHDSPRRTVRQHCLRLESGYSIELESSVSSPVRKCIQQKPTTSWPKSMSFVSFYKSPVELCCG